MDNEDNSDQLESNPTEQAQKLNFECSVKNCNQKFKGNKKGEAQQDFLLHFKQAHETLVTEQGSQNEKTIIRTYLRKHQKLNYFCKICQQNGEEQRFSQVNNVKDRSGLEPHVKHKHPEFYTLPEQLEKKQNDQNAWREQWCGYSGPQKTTVGRPNNNYIPQKYGPRSQDAESDNEINEEEEEFYKSLGIDVRKNRSIDLPEFKKYLDIIEILFQKKDFIEQKQSQYYANQQQSQFNIEYIKSLGNYYLAQFLDSKGQDRISNLCFLIYNQKNPEVRKAENSSQYPEGCQDYLKLIVETCVKKLRYDKSQEVFQAPDQEQEVLAQFPEVYSHFSQFFQEIQTNNLQNV